MATGHYRHLVRVQRPTGTPLPNGDGGYSDPWVDATPSTWACQITEGTGSSERVIAGSTQATGTHQLRGHYRADIDVRCRVLVRETQVFAVVGVNNPGFLDVDLVLTCVRLDETAVPPEPAPVPESSFYQEGFSQEGFCQEYGDDS